MKIKKNASTNYTLNTHIESMLETALETSKEALNTAQANKLEIARLVERTTIVANETKEDIAELKEAIYNLVGKVDGFQNSLVKTWEGRETALKKNFVSREEFEPLKRTFYLVGSAVVLAVAGAIMSGVLIK